MADGKTESAETRHLPSVTAPETLRTLSTKLLPKLEIDNEHWEPFGVSAATEALLPELIERADLQAAPGYVADMAPLLRKLTIACRHGASESFDRKAQAVLMTEYLAGYALDAVAWAVDQWIRTQVFFPAISELLALCEARQRQLRCARVRLERLWWHQKAIKDRREEDARLAADALTPERQAELAARLKAAKQHLSQGERPKPKFRAVHIDFTEEQREAALRRVERGEFGLEPAEVERIKKEHGR